MEENTCPIWGTPAEVKMLRNDSLSVNSPRTGGRYIITGTRAVVAGGWSEEQRMLVTSWLVNQRSMGDAEPRISDAMEIDSIRRPSVFERAENLLKYINSQLTSIGDVFRTPYKPQDLEKNHTKWVRYSKILAWSASTKLNDVEYLLKFLENQDLIASPSKEISVTKRCILTPKGHAHLAKSRNPTVDSTRAFVAMWFDSSLDGAFYKGIEPGIKACGYSAVRIDQSEHLDKIDDQIIAAIRRAKFLVVDLTEGEVVKQEDGTITGGTRGSVYFEAGFAHGLDIPIIFTRRKNSPGKIHFDIQQYPCIFWSTPQELKSRLASRIAANFGDAPSPAQSVSGGVLDDVGGNANDE